MKTKLILFLFLLCTFCAVGQNVSRQKCPTCGKLKVQCPYKGKHPAPTPKPEPKPEKTCANCGKVVSKCPYKGKHPAPAPQPAEKTCTNCGKVISKCPYKGKHPAPEASGYDVSFSCNVSSATMFVDGSNYGTPSGVKYLKTGYHQIKITAEGYEDYSSSINVSRSNTSFSFSLKKEEAKIKNVSGVVVDKYNEPLVGATVLIKGTNNGRVADINGKFEIKNVSTKDVLVISYIGCETQEVKITNETNTIKVVMQYMAGTEVGYEYVDLGLSVKWAAYNVGASKPEDFGNYFAWGETRPKSDYSWKTYFDSVNGSSSKFNKYATDKATTLDLSDDAAHANWGGSWRMPTKAEQDELREKCTWTLTTKNGVKGYEVTSKTNGNAIFLPAAGCRDGGHLYNAGSYGYYWSSSLSESRSSLAYFLYFHSGNVGLGSYLYRNDGFSVRGVCP